MDAGAFFLSSSSDSGTQQGRELNHANEQSEHPLALRHFPRLRAHSLSSALAPINLLQLQEGARLLTALQWVT